MSQAAKNPITAQEQLEMDIMAETELGRLQRQYRIMDSDRRAFQEETRIQLQKQHRVLKVLRKEETEILKDFNVCSSKANQRKNVKFCIEIQRLLDENDAYDDAIYKQKNDLREIEDQIKKASKDIDLYRKKQVTDEQLQQRISNNQRNVDALQNKYGHCVNRFCIVLADNKGLREEIDHLLRERNLFNSIWEKYLQSLNTGKKIMMDLVEQATMSYDQREEWCHKLQALRLRAHNDSIAHMSEMRELFRQLDHDASLQDFLSVKGQRRIMRDLEQKEQMKRQQAKEDLEKQLLHYRETLGKVQELAEEEDITKLAAEFVKQEEENFALFNYVNELNHELETLTDNISNLHSNIDEQKEINEKRAEEQMDTIESLKAELRKAQEEERQKKEILAKKQTELEHMLKGIEYLFKMVRCDNTPILNLLGETGNITIHNVMIYLGILENKVTELLKITNYQDNVIILSDESIHPLLRTSYSPHILRFPNKNPCAFCAEMFMTEGLQEYPEKPKCYHEIKEPTYGNYTGDIVLHTLSECKVNQELSPENSTIKAPK